MAVITYEDRDYTLDVRAATPDQAKTLRRFGVPVSDLRSRVASQDLKALQGLYWLMLSQNGGTSLRVQDVNFKPARFLQALVDAEA